MPKTEPKQCTAKPYCPYGLEAYDQDSDRWAKNVPCHNGLCINCIDDDRIANDWMESEIDFDLIDDYFFLKP